MREKLIPKVLKVHKACMLTEVLWPLQNTFVSGRCQELKQRKGIRVSDIIQDSHYIMKWKIAGTHCITTFVIGFKLPNVLNLLLSNEKSKLNIYSIGMWQDSCMNYASFKIIQ